MAKRIIKTAISGVAGRMGTELVKAVAASPDFELACAFEQKGHRLLGQDAGAAAGIKPLGVQIAADEGLAACKAEVLIEFTLPAPTLAHLEIASAMKLPAVIGTTGFSDAQKAEFRNFARKIAILFSPNMSVGVNLLFALAKKSAQTLGAGFDLEVIEAHHRLKQDAPSGTALKLAEALAQGRGWEFSRVACYHRQGITGIRPEKQIGIQTIRGGDIIGEHTAILAGTGERIELTHRASSRQTFAQGALRAAAWILDKPPGLYSMGDCLGIE